MISATFLRERAAYYRDLAKTPEMLDRADRLRVLAATFERGTVRAVQSELRSPLANEASKLGTF